MAVLTVQTIAIAGLEPTYAAAAGGGDSFPNTGDQFLHVKNGGVGDVTVTLTTPATVEGVAIADPTVVVTAGEDRMIGPFPPSIFNDGNGRVAVGYSGVTSVTVAAIKL